MTTPNQENPNSEAPPAEWIAALNQFLQKVDPRDAERAYQDIQAYAEGKKTWAEVQGIPKQFMYDWAEKAYLKFKSSRFDEAEMIFKVLCLWDHKTAYYHTALGAIYQKKQQYLDALAEYTVAIEIDPEDITAYVNRGEIYFQLGYNDLPLQDFESAINLDTQNKDPWANRARFLKKRLLEEIARNS